jgi:hypothetical protein
MTSIKNHFQNNVNETIQVEYNLYSSLGPPASRSGSPSPSYASLDPHPAPLVSTEFGQSYTTVEQPPGYGQDRSYFPGMVSQYETVGNQTSPQVLNPTGTGQGGLYNVFAGRELAAMQ